eukprot:7529637-Pyramimonas_sp.AAC.1
MRRPRSGPNNNIHPLFAPLQTGWAEFKDDDDDGNTWVSIRSNGNALLVGRRLCSAAGLTGAWPAGEASMPGGLSRFRLSQHEAYKPAALADAPPRKE